MMRDVDKKYKKTDCRVEHLPSQVLKLSCYSNDEMVRCNKVATASNMKDQANYTASLVLSLKGQKLNKNKRDKPMKFYKIEEIEKMI